MKDENLLSVLILKERILRAVGEVFAMKVVNVMKGKKIYGEQMRSEKWL